MQLFLKNFFFKNFKFFYKKMFWAFWALDMAPTLDVLVLLVGAFSLKEKKPDSYSE